MTDSASQTDHFEPPASTSYDVIVIGGGVVGSATAWHLLEASPGMRVLVVEPDPSFGQAASSAASGGVRQLFTRPENVLMSQYTLDLIDDWADWRPPNGETPPPSASELSWKNNGYLFITSTELSDQLREDYERQQALGVQSEWLEQDALQSRYPLFETSDLGPAVLSRRDGWLDSTAFATGLRYRAQSLGAEYVRNRAVGFDVSGRRIASVALDTGHTAAADFVVNVAGVWGTGLSAQLGLDVPVEPMRRFDHYVRTTHDFSAYPFIKDPAGLAVRPEGDGINAALVDFSTPGGWDLSIDTAYFEDVVWPALYERLPVTEDLKLVTTWSGFYDQNRFDGNMILDTWSDELDNYSFATGFSGHGLMHAPAVGRALAELVTHGSFQTLDLTRMSLERLKRNEPYRESTIR